jgi:hypothetical protein
MNCGFSACDEYPSFWHGALKKRNFTVHTKESAILANVPVEFKWFSFLPIHATKTDPGHGG